MDIEQEKRIKRNIRKLKEAYGKTWDEIAIDLNYESGSAISNYVSDARRLPDDEILTRIANYFGITLKNLKELDFSNVESNNNTQIEEETIQLEDFKDLSAYIFGEILPLAESEQALKNEDFSNSIALHKKLFNSSEGAAFVLKNFGTIYNGYVRAVKVGIIEASVNALCLLQIYWVFIINSNIYKHDDIYNWIESLTSEGMTEEQFEEFMLSSSRGILNFYQTSEGREMVNSFFDKYNSSMTGFMRRLQESTDYYEFAYYYLALRYKSCMLDPRLTGYSFDEESSFGEQLLFYISYMGNRYAKRYLNFFKDEE